MKAAAREPALRIVSAGETHPGGRPHNEDAVLVRRDLDLYAVADGAGGQQAGSVASAIATTSVAHYFEQTKAGALNMPEVDVLGLPTAARRLATAVQRANREVLEVAKSSARHRGMGTTLVVAVPAVRRDVLHIAHVGDSRCYRYRAGRLEQLTRDHTVIHDVLETRPDMSDQDAARLPRNAVTNALGMAPELRVSVATHRIVVGDQYLLCTDGISDTLDEDLIAAVMQRAKGPAEQVRLLIETALQNECHDNVAAVVIAFAAAEASTGASAGTSPERPRSEQPPSQRARQGRSARPSEAPLRRSRTPAAPRPGSEAEIVFVRSEARSPRDSTPMIHVLPAESAVPEVLSAVQGLVESRSPSEVEITVAPAPPAREQLPTLDFTGQESIRCPKCSSRIEGMLPFCPECGAALHL